MINLFKGFAKSKDGNIAVMTGISLVLIVVAAGIAVDYSRLTHSAQQLRDLTDAATVSVARAENATLAERTEIFENYMTSSIATTKELEGFEYTLDVKEDRFGSLTVNSTTRSKSTLFFSNITGGEKFVAATSEVVAGKEFLEIALVVDISTSMQGARIIEMQNSARNFIQTLTSQSNFSDRVSIAIVPFGGTVRLPSELETLLNPPSTTEHWAGGTWNGCLAVEPSDYATGIRPNARIDFLPDFTIFTNNNTACPAAGNELLGLSSDPDVLLQKIDSFRLSDGTGTDIGMAWGYSMLDPVWRRRLTGVHRSSPRGFSELTRKIIVVMTDGGITAQFIPLASELTGPLPYKSKNILVPENETKKGFADICNLSKSKGMEVYTVSFAQNNATDVANLQACGTSASHNFESGVGGLNAAFQEVANSIVAAGLRITR